MTQNFHIERKMLRVSDAAAALGLSRIAVWSAIRRGDINAVRIGRSYLIPRSALQELLDPKARRRKERNTASGERVTVSAKR